MNTLIKYKGIVHNVLNDAPFIGAIIIANSCHKGCADCINEHLKTDSYTVLQTAREIIKQVLDNGLNQGIILSGLEWTEQPKDLNAIVHEAIKHHLKVMVYTHHTEENFFEILPEFRKQNVYIKFGHYDQALSSPSHYSHTVKLATTNQYIKLFGESI
ncbi:4Fe-4S cluster-binding domain-containing protein [Fusibacter bizertensis]